jgi:putative tryptophan/tyrosine transport system substrate-binding protein
LRRREFISLIAGAATWPVSARGQEAGRVRRIGALSNLSESDPEIKRRNEAFEGGLRERGWVIGRNLLIDYRWSSGNPDKLQSDAAELAALKPDLVFATSGVSILPLQQASPNVPLLFAQTIDPVGLGIVESLSHPGGNATGFTALEFGITAKWLELLKQMAPRTTRVAVLRDPFDPAGIGQWAAAQPVAPALNVELSAVNIRDPAALESGIERIAKVQNAALLITSSSPGALHRNLITGLAARHRLPAIYPSRNFVAAAGGLFGYGPDPTDQYGRAAVYADRLLKGEKPGDLPVQAPTKYDLVINLKTAKALNLEAPATLLAQADEVIE